MIKLKCLGASQEVGRSSFLVDSGDKILLDRGVKLTPGDTLYPLPVETNLSAAIISHAHLDHSGHLPSLFTAADCLCYMTPPTLELSKLLWSDTLKIAGYEGLVAPFTKEEIRRADKFTFQAGWKRPLDITNNTRMTLYDAGHISGASMVKLETAGKNILYTGDFKLEEQRLYKGADFKSVGNVDTVIIDSTYGDRDHPPREKVEKEFVRAVKEALEGGGHALVPAFAVGRSQEMIDILVEHKVDADIYLDGMGKTAAKIMLDHPQYLRNPKFLKKALDKAKWVKNINMRKKALKEPSVIVTTAGMLSGGPVYAYLPEIYKDKRSKLLLTGYQVEETPGRILRETGKINLDGLNVEVKMEVKQFDFSAHAGHTELIKAVSKLNPEKVVCVHGDENVTTKFRTELKKKGFDAYAPELGDEIILG